MEFHEFPTLYSHIKRVTRGKTQSGKKFPDPMRFYAEFTHRALRNRQLAPEQERMLLAQAMSENRWLGDGRPFYKVWPKIVPALLKLDLTKVTCDIIRSIVPVLSVRLPVQNNPMTYGDLQVRSFMMCSMAVLPSSIEDEHLIDYFSRDKHPDPLGQGVIFWCDFGETMDGGPAAAYRFFPLDSGMTVHEAIDGLPYDPAWENGWKIPTEAMDDVVRLYCTLMLIDQGDDTLEEVVLSKDQQKWEDTHDPKYVEKAKKRGVFGWHVGRSIEVSPHFRRPHYGWRWTGPGKKIPKWTKIKGSVIHKELVKTIPTGHQGEDDGTDTVPPSSPG